MLRTEPGYGEAQSERPMKGADKWIPDADHCTAGCVRRSVFAGFGVVELAERLGVEGHVGALAVLVGRVDLIAAALDLNLPDLVAVGLQL